MALLNAPTSVALLLHLLGCRLFAPLAFLSPEINPQQPSSGPTPPQFATAIVSLAVAILLSQFSLWPPELRKPPKPLLFTIQLLFSLFVLEFALNVIWFPLEENYYELWHPLSQMAATPEAKKQKNISMCCEIIQMIVNLLGCKCVPGLISYIMSLTCLGCILHITRIQDVYKSNC